MNTNPLHPTEYLSTLPQGGDEAASQPATHSDVNTLPPDLTGRTFGDWNVLRKIGSGAMADVYLADQRSLDRRIALKILKSHLATDKTYINRFVREAKAAARLVHPNIVHIYEVDCRDGNWYIAQEYVQGTNLAQILKRNGSLSARRTFEILWQVASALAKSQQEGIVHRDIKPENILLGDDGNVKVADFGLARLQEKTGTSSSTNLTQIGMTLGTPLYMSPEQSEGKSTDTRSDIYSLGITCYHMLAGFAPFRGDTALSVAIQHLQSEAEPLELIRPDIPPPFARLIHRMMAKKPQDRFQTVKELQQTLKALYSQYFAGSVNIDGLSEWEILHLDGADTRRLASTERLQAAIEEERQLYRCRNFRIRLGIAAVCCAIFCGITAAVIQRNFVVDLLPPPVVSTKIPKFDTVSLQWVYATKFDNEDVWKSVIDYFPNDIFWTKHAKQQLARRYMADGDILHAMTLFQEFADKDDTETHDRAFGLAGLMWGYSQLGMENMAYQCFDDLASLRVELEPITQFILETAIRSFRSTAPKSPSK